MIDLMFMESIVSLTYALFDNENFKSNVGKGDVERPTDHQEGKLLPSNNGELQIFGDPEGVVGKLLVLNIEPIELTLNTEDLGVDSLE